MCLWAGWLVSWLAIERLGEPTFVHTLSLTPLGKLGLVQVEWAEFQESDGQRASLLEAHAQNTYSHILLVKASYEASLDLRDAEEASFLVAKGHRHRCILL